VSCIDDDVDDLLLLDFIMQAGGLSVFSRPPVQMYSIKMRCDLIKSVHQKTFSRSS
jgi:hypothetical protein